jgi:hypothetical protein
VWRCRWCTKKCWRTVSQKLSILTTVYGIWVPCVPKLLWRAFVCYRMIHRQWTNNSHDYRQKVCNTLWGIYLQFSERSVPYKRVPWPVLQNNVGMYVIVGLLPHDKSTSNNFSLCSFIHPSYIKILTLLPKKGSL